MQALKRELGTFGAVMMGLGSIVGTGIFVSAGIAAGITGSSVVLAMIVAALVAGCNGLSSAQLAANHPVSGGTYEYGYRYLNPLLGFTAGWSFLLAKSASAATAALGFAGYLLNAIAPDQQHGRVALALLALIALTALVLGGIRRSNLANTLIVSVTLITLISYVLFSLPAVHMANFEPFFPSTEQGGIFAFLQACALMFVAYTGYGRIATMGEEVREPRRTIPRAIIITLLATLALYSAVTAVTVGTVGAQAFGESARQGVAPLEQAARTLPTPFVAPLIMIGATTAMLGVLLNLLLGLSRVLMAMGRRGDMPPQVAYVRMRTATPSVAVIVIAVLIGLLVLTGNVRTTWSFSAFTVLIYYAITNLAALRLSASERLFPRILSWIGLLSCLFLAFWVDMVVWLLGLALLAAGILWHLFAGIIWRTP
jgi:APA family basic amino acid/polyamine antiporter